MSEHEDLRVALKSGTVFGPYGVQTRLLSLLDDYEGLLRWKTEMLAVLAGLQELGKSLDLPIGERVTGDVAVKAVENLKARAETAEARLRERTKGG